MLEASIERWEKEILQKGILQGKAEGKAERLSEGISIVAATQKSTLLDMLSGHFGEIPPSWRSAIGQIAEPDISSKLTRAILHELY